ncbi:DUF4430 domain-containing protein [Ruminococcus sp.]|uniref:DUF4430 domain-containing protein n=1 Tax=Ruminococcus sp. TaxID=41978 RepID=UPI00388CFA4D
MQNKKLFAALLVFLTLLSCVVPVQAESVSEVYTVARVENLRDGIVAYNGAFDDQAFIDHTLVSNAGTTAEFYVIALSQSGDYGFSAYERALKSYLESHDVYAATSREKYALTLAAVGSTDRYIADTADEAIGELGVMSLVFGLHLLNNGYDSRLYTTDGLISELLSWQKDDGGWAVMGSYGDADVTAMTLQALAPHYGGRGDVTAAVNRALDRLSAMQLDSGGFKTMGAENCESAAQVIIALSALGIDAQTDGRFVKNGSSVMNAMLRYRCSDGSFAHTGDSSNENATMEAFCALTAYCRYCRGQGSLYLLDHVNHSAPSRDDDGEDTRRGSGSDGSSSHSAGSSGSRDDSGDRTGSGNDNRSGGSASGEALDRQSATDANGNRIIEINGQRYIEATTASGERMTINVNETEATQAPPETVQGAKPTYGGFQPAATADMRATADEGGAQGSYKPYAVIGICLSAGIACAVLLALKKRNKKHYLAVAVIAAAGILFVLLTDFRSADSKKSFAPSDSGATVTISIRCDTIKDREKVNRYIPDDGVILDQTTVTAAEGETVYDVLLRAADDRDIPLDNRGAEGAAYIAGINGLYEFDYGALSGWMYRVNGAFPDVGCQSYTVSDGDRIEWLYTTDIGKDLS